MSDVILVQKTKEGVGRSAEKLLLRATVFTASSELAEMQKIVASKQSRQQKTTTTTRMYELVNKSMCTSTLYSSGH